MDAMPGLSHRYQSGQLHTAYLRHVKCSLDERQSSPPLRYFGNLDRLTDKGNHVEKSETPFTYTRCE